MRTPVCAKHLRRCIRLLFVLSPHPPSPSSGGPFHRQGHDRAERWTESRHATNQRQWSDSGEPHIRRAMIPLSRDRPWHLPPNLI